MSEPTSPENSGSEKKPRRPARKKAAKKKAQSKSKAGAAESPFDLPTAPEEAEFIIIGGDGEEYGPRPIEVVRRWIATGRANARTLARTAPDAAWQPLGQIPELVPLLEESRPPLPGKVTAIAIITLTGGLITMAWPLWLWDLNLGFWWWCCLWPSVPFSLVLGIPATIQGVKLLGRGAAAALPRTGTSASLLICGIIVCNPISLILGIILHALLGSEEVVGYLRSTQSKS